MTTQKTFDRADLVRFFHDHGNPAQVGSFTVIKPSPTLYGETENLRYPVEAQTTAYWCERSALCMVVQSVCFVDGGDRYLDKSHPLRQGRRVTVRYGDGGSSAQLVRWATELADDWRKEIGVYVPYRPIDLRTHMQDVADAETAVAEQEGDAHTHFAEAIGDRDGTAGDAPVDDDHTPTGTSIDDVLSDNEGDATA